MKRLFASALTAATLLGAAALPAQANIIFDDFESYDADELIGSAANDQVSWYRSGAAARDIYATGAADTPMSGSRSAKMGLNWVNGSGSASPRTYFSTTPDLTGVEEIKVTVRSSNADTTTTVRFVVMRAGTYWETRSTYAGDLTDAVQTFTFDPSTSVTMSRIAFTPGDARQLENVLAAPDLVGLTFHSPGGGTYSETVYFDDFFAVPEPIVAPAVLGLALMLRTRR